VRICGCDSRSDIHGLPGLVGSEVMIDKIPQVGYTACRAGGFRDSWQSVGPGGSGDAFKLVLSGGTARVAQVVRHRGLEARGLMAWRRAHGRASSGYGRTTATQVVPPFDRGLS
jgi:hypothetical protein